MAAHGENVEQGSAHRILAMLVNGVHRAVAIERQVSDQGVAVQGLSDIQCQAIACNVMHGWAALHQGGDRHQQDSRGHLGQSVKGVQTLRNDVLMGRKVVVRERLPVGQCQYFCGRIQKQR